eukprot:CAMPEP_0171627602 /NCGR_PEP_ID=MMETSP0990-20121206/20871_1 /TAXON_ID=483369 /ORGANISM="non described non described, Strain CCMP2098" /LENGTH=206 /DNA_ID=CAMNT_0012195491 /DNA_START=374 /DNA_END=994 /DNA_ORIENTATION=-
MTLVLVTNGNYSRILLGMKKRGLGIGKWNGFGGKLEPGESIEAAAARELHEESGVVALNLERRGVVWQKFVNDPVALEFHVFHADKFEGTPMESDEMAPKWFEIGDIPFQEMWKDDEIWYPAFLRREYFRLFLLFRGTETMLGHHIEQVDSTDLAPCTDLAGTWGEKWKGEAEMARENSLTLLEDGTIVDPILQAHQSVVVKAPLI